MEKIGILGCGAMGSGIAQVAASAGHEVIVHDLQPNAASKAIQKTQENLRKLVEKGKMTAEASETLLSKIQIGASIASMSDCSAVIECIVEDLEQKQLALRSLEAVIGPDAILGTNTSSLPITAIAAQLQRPARCIGIHFFNPPTLMRLVEIIPAIQTEPDVVKSAKALVDSWGKTAVLCKDTPGFIVNRIARPFYGEAIKMFEEGFADMPTIDWAMKTFGGFRMGPFELMDFIGHDVNYKVTEVVFEALFFDPRYRPSIAQRRLVDARFFGRKSGRGFFDYSEGAQNPQPDASDEALGEAIFRRILAMLINEAAEAVFLNIASRDDIELAMTQGVNYPKGLLRWADELGIERIVEKMDELHAEFLDARYRCSPLLRKMAREGKTFF